MLNICKRCAALLVPKLSWTRTVSYRQMSRAKRQKKREERESTVHQLVGDHAKRAQRVYVWGCASTGALGIKSYMKPERNQIPITKMPRPARLRFTNDHRIMVTDLACGYGFTVLTGKTTEKKMMIFGTGINTDSQIGYHEMPKNSGRILDYLVEPAPISLPVRNQDDISILQVACGRVHTLVLTNQGVFSLGNNSYGQCGRPIVEGEVYSKSILVNKIEGLPDDVTKVVCGQDCSFFLTESGQVYSCGLGADGQTGLGHYSTVHRPQKVKGDMEGVMITQLACHADCVLAVSQEGHMFGWGNSEYDQLGMVTEETQVNVPRHLPVRDSGNITKAVAGGSICAFINDKGEVFVWGYGILGKGPNLHSTKYPEMIPHALFGPGDGAANFVTDIQCGMSHFLALTKIGNVYSWGKNTSGCLGLTVNRNQYFPLHVILPAEANSIHCGVDHCAVICKSFV